MRAGTASARFTSRNGNDVSAAWPDVTTSPLGDRDLLVDGELIALNENGLPDFRVLQERMHVRNAQSVRRLAQRLPVTYMVFDLLRLDGRDLTAEPLEKRRDLLAEVLDGAAWQVPALLRRRPDALRRHPRPGPRGHREQAAQLPLRASTARSRHWLKFAHRHRLSYVVGGWRPQEGTTDRLAALLVGEPTPDGLLYRGRVGSGIGSKQSRQLADLVAGLSRAASPFADEVPRVDATGTLWLEPVVVVDVDTHGRGYQRLRQPSYRGVRTDLTPEDLL